MMKFLGSNAGRYAISMVLRASFYSTEALVSSSSPPFQSLHRRISRDGNPRVSIVPVLERWVEEERDVTQSELQSFIRQLRRFRRYSHALQISEWMSDERNHDLSPADIAIRLGLISKVHGLEQAEKYFSSIPDPLRISKVYVALLHCYAEHKSLKKAESIFEKMQELGFVKGPLPYNVMLTLYCQMGKHAKLDNLVKEMEEKGIGYDSYTWKIQLNSHVATTNIDRMEKLLMKIEANSLVTIDWYGYVLAANGFLKAGLLEKTSTMLRRSEQLISNKTRKFAYEVLLTSYAALGNKTELYRIWTLYKNMVGLYNSGYLCMLSSLVKLDDIDGAESIVEEWESTTASFDIRIPNLLITAYCKKGLLEKAITYVEQHTKSGKEIDASTWARLANGYYLNGQMEKAVETMKKAILESQPGWRSDYSTLAACLEYLKEKGDVEVALESVRLLRERDHFSTELCDKLENYINGEPQKREVEVSHKLLRLLSESDHLSTDLYDKFENSTIGESQVLVSLDQLIK